MPNTKSDTEVRKLNSVVGFRPTDAELRAIEAAELATGRNRSDILRACFEEAITTVTEAMRAERDAGMEVLEAALKETGNTTSYRNKSKGRSGPT